VFLLEVFTKNRAEVGASASDLTTDQSAITVLGEFLNSTRARHTLTTNRIWVSPGKPTKGAIQVLSDLAKIYDLRVHIGREDRIIRIASTYLTEWMSERGYSRVTWVKKMEEEFGLRKTVGILGGGTELVGAKEMLLELDMNHVAKHGDQERRFIASISPSDGRAMRNFEGNVRRWVKELHHERPEETTR
jgi:hypothetical protein